jgi:peptidoglycan/LPS O-acetylase OafA/YrhL
MKFQKIYELESLRGIFAFLIVIFHFPTDNILYNNSFTKNSFFAVDFFFVLSGFIISLNYEDKIDNFKELKLFFKKRFFRLYPLHLLFLMIFVVLELFKLFLAINYEIIPNNGFSNFTDFIKNILLIHGLNGQSFNEPSWSISVEFICYIIFGFYCLSAKKLYLTPVFLIFFGAFLILMDPNHTSFAQLGRCIYSFFIGYYVYKLSKKNIVINSKYISLILFVISLYSISIEFKHKFLILPLLFSLNIFLIVKNNKLAILNEFLNLSFFKFLGKISYSMYLTHYIIAYALRQILHFVFKFEYSNELLSLNYYFFPIILFYFFVVIVLSNFTFNIIENKYRLK